MSEAYYFMVAAHEAVGQKRKYTGEPYWKHPDEVAELVKKTYDYTAIYGYMYDAAWLHDVVEDTQVTIETIFAFFGEETAQIVKDLTDEPLTTGNRTLRNQLNTERLANASSEAQTIKYADIICNTKDIVDYDPKFAKVYLKEVYEKLQVMTKGDGELRRMAIQIVEQGMEKLK